MTEPENQEFSPEDDTQATIALFLRRVDIQRSDFPVIVVSEKVPRFGTYAEDPERYRINRADAEAVDDQDNDQLGSD